MAKVEFSPCYILHSRNYRESSLLLDIFSLDHGRLSLVAKGIKRNKKQQPAGYQAYQKYLISWLIKTNLGTLTHIETYGRTVQLEPQQIMAGFYLNEITLRLLHQHEAHPALFYAYDRVIQQLDQAEPEEIILRYFEKALLQSLGYGLVLDCDVETGENIDEEKEYVYQLDYGPVLSSPSFMQDGIKVSGKTLKQINTESLDNTNSTNEAKRLLKAILNRYLGEKPLASRVLYQAYLKNKKAS